MNSKQIAGWLLVILGIGIIVWALYASFQIFSGKELPPQIFVIESQPATPTSKALDLQKQAEEAINNLVQEQLRGLLPADSVPKLLNLISWSIFAWLLLMGGGQLAGIGVRLLKQ